jgi:uncharacterized Zn finger protein
MPFPLKDFGSFIEAKIRERGYRYLMDNRIVHLEETKPNEWRAEVQGSEMYRVHIDLNEGVVERSRCSCPYDYGPVCKHVAAVCYSLRMKLQNTEPEPEEYEKNLKEKSKKKTRQKRTGRKTVAEQIEKKIDRLHSGQIRGFLQEILEEDRHLRSVFMARFADPEPPQSKADYRKQVKRILKPAKQKSRRPILYGREAYRHLEGIREMLSGCERQLNQGQVSSVITACQVIIEEVVPAFQYIDDSDGQLGYLVDRSFELIDDVAGQKLDESIRMAFFEDCLQQFNDERYSGWDFGKHFLDLAIKLSQSSEEFDEIEELLNKQLSQSRENTDSDLIFGYNKERHAEQLLNLYETAGREEQRLAFMEENRDLSNIMQRLIRYAWQEKDYERVKTYSEEALQEFKSKPGLSSQWMEWLLKAAEAEKDVVEQKAVTERLLFNTGRIEWYRHLKKLYDKEQWPEKTDELLQSQQGGRWRYSGLVPSICIEEERWDDLFEYVKSNPSLHTLQHYDSWLKDDFLDELMALYKDALLRYMESNTGRKYYKDTRAILKRMKALGGSRTANEIVQILQNKYENRPALQDELMKSGLID